MAAGDAVAVARRYHGWDGPSVDFSPTRLVGSCDSMRNTMPVWSVKPNLVSFNAAISAAEKAG